MKLFEISSSLIEKLFFNHFPKLYWYIYSFYKLMTDKAEQNLYQSLIVPGMLITDVGANIGFYTNFFARLVGREGEVHAFEPEAANYKFLSNRLSNQENIILNQQAVGHQTGNVEFYISSHLNVDHRAYNDGENRKKISVDSTTLDAYFPSGKRVDLIKIDVQGFEYQALMGMERVLTDNDSIIVVLEYFPFGLEMAGSNSGELRRHLTENGFSLYSISRGGNMVMLNNEPKLNSLGYTNIIAKRD